MRLYRLLLGLGLLPLMASADTRFAPEQWILWRAAPIDFPDRLQPQVPELMTGEAPIDFKTNGSDLTIVMPDSLGGDYDSRALQWAQRFIVNKVPRAQVVPAGQVTTEHLAHHLLILGTVENNAFARRVLGASAGTYLAGLHPRGYRIGTQAHPTRPDKRVILALGVDLPGAYSAGAVLCHAIHPNKEGVNQIAQWPARIPTGCYWLPFAASANPPLEEFEVTSAPHPAPAPPLVPVALRVWGSPMPSLASYQRLVRAMKRAGLNTVVVQSGGLVDLPDAPARFVKLLDIAWQEGLYTCLYVGNEETAHVAAPLSENHRAVILATKDHPGLLAFHLYNQLGTKHTPTEYADLEHQIRWVNSLTDKPTSIEIVWGHNLVPIPADKQTLMRDVRAWGLDIISTDYAPIGGWAQKPYLPRWEQKLLTLRTFETKPEVLLQAHVPFLEATVPTREQVLNQFWWALAGGTHCFFIETAYLTTHLSMRGVLSWTFDPLPDGRYEAVREIARTAPKLAEFIRDAQILSEQATASTGLSLKRAPRTLHLRVRKLPDGALYALVINEDLTKSASAELHAAGPVRWEATDALEAKTAGQLSASAPLKFEVPAGGAACFKLIPSTAR